MRHNSFNFTIGAVLRAHPIYGHPAIEDYEGFWWDLAYEYGYQDYLVPLNDLNENGEIDSYYLWIETDPDTEEGYWIYYYEDADFYWEDVNANTVAYSDAEFLQYHYPHVVHMYNEDNKIEEWQSEINVALGFDILFGGKSSIHIYGLMLFLNLMGSQIRLMTEKTCNMTLAQLLVLI